MKRTRTAPPAPLLPGMPRPEFGGATLLPGMESQRPADWQRTSTRSWGPLFEPIMENAQPSLLDEIERGYMRQEFGEAAELIGGER